MRPFLKFKLAYQYISQRVSFASLIALKQCQAGQIASKDVWRTVFNKMFTTEMLLLFREDNLEMAPTITPKDTLVIRRFPPVNPSFLPLVKEYFPQINVGDVVVLRDPSDPKSCLIRRLVAVEGYEMVSTNEEDEPFVIEEGQGWVLADNKSLSPKESKDSRTYGPVLMSDIMGRIIYRFRERDDHGLMVNNKLSMTYDMPILFLELDSIKLQEYADKGKQTENSKDVN